MTGFNEVYLCPASGFVIVCTLTLLNQAHSGGGTRFVSHGIRIDEGCESPLLRPTHR